MDEKKPNPKVKKPKDKKKIAGIVVFIVGLITLIAGVVFLVLKFVGASAMQDGVYLTQAKEWVMDGADGVIWDFTEIGKGTLTTNNHLNDYHFEWSLEDGKLIIQTEWLYTLDNRYDYTLNQRDGTLTLKDGDKEFKFKKVAEEAQE